MTLSRRTLLGNLGVGAAVACAPTIVFGASFRDGHKGGGAAKKIILGGGEHMYEWVPGWAKLPEGKSLASTHGGVQTDAADNVYVTTDNGNDSMHVFDKDGKYIKSWGKTFAGGSVHGIQLIKEGDQEIMLVAHTGRRKVYKTDLDGKVLMELGWPKEAGTMKDDKRYRPTMVAQAPNGDLYVADGYGSNYIYRFDKDGKFLNAWNGSKTPAGRFRTPHGCWVDTRGKEPTLMVADRANGRLVSFKPDGSLVKVVFTGLRYPCKVSIRHDDVLVPNLRGGVVILDKNNQLVTAFGSNSRGFRGNFKTPPAEFRDGMFTAPHGACWDSEGNLYVEDWNASGRVSKLKRIKA